MQHLEVEENGGKNTMLQPKNRNKGRSDDWQLILWHGRLSLAYLPHSHLLLLLLLHSSMHDSISCSWWNERMEEEERAQRTASRLSGEEEGGEG